jgi:hypothetical protein
MSDTNITPLRPKAKDATGAQRQAKYRKKRKPVVTVASAPPAVAHPILTPSPQKGRDIAPVTAPRNGSTIDVAAYTAAIALAGAAAFFSVKGMVTLFRVHPSPSSAWRQPWRAPSSSPLGGLPGGGEQRHGSGGASWLPWSQASVSSMPRASMRREGRSDVRHRDARCCPRR